MNKEIAEYFKFLKPNAIIREDMRAGLPGIKGLTDGAVLSVVSGVSAVTLILVLAVSHTHAPVLTR